MEYSMTIIPVTKGIGIAEYAKRRPRWPLFWRESIDRIIGIARIKAVIAKNWFRYIPVRTKNSVMPKRYFR